SQFLQSQKMESVGRLAGGVAHDFNNHLTTIIGYAALVMMRLGKDDPLHSQVKEIKDAADRATSLTRQLLAFSRKQVLQTKVMVINTVVTDVEKMLRRLIGEDIELVTMLEPELGRVKADPSQIDQVIMNLAVNAKDAMPEGGKLTIETGNVTLDSHYAEQHGVEIKQGAYVMLSVSDTGTGIDVETQEHIFEPFFTTKEKGKGTGLGLSTVYGIMKQSDGYIWVYSEPGQGTTFKVYFPAAEEAGKVKQEEKPSFLELKGSETILIVEDNESVRNLACNVLGEYGYRVLEAKDGEEALSVVKGHEGKIHLLLTDVVMPGMRGNELAERIKIERRDMEVLYMSGYTDNAIVHHGVLEEGMNFIQKPFSPDELARKVRETLDH
ncbi:MAG: ATP-binding protein, partial [Pseudomonadota bacterium]